MLECPKCKRDTAFVWREGDGKDYCTCIDCRHDFERISENNVRHWHSPHWKWKSRYIDDTLCRYCGHEIILFSDRWCPLSDPVVGSCTCPDGKIHFSRRRKPANEEFIRAKYKERRKEMRRLANAPTTKAWKAWVKSLEKAD